MLKYRVGAPAGRGHADTEAHAVHQSNAATTVQTTYSGNSEPVHQTQHQIDQAQSVDVTDSFQAGQDINVPVPTADHTQIPLYQPVNDASVHSLGDTGHSAYGDESINAQNEPGVDYRNTSMDPSIAGQHVQDEQSGYGDQNLSYTDVLCQNKFREGVTETDLLQIDTFYRSHKSEVFVCASLANLYYGSAKSDDQWTFTATGIPLLLLDTGEHHRQRKLSIILAEKGTGFTLWRDIIDGQTCYKTPNPKFHTMRLSTDYTKTIGLSYDEAEKAQDFYSHLESLISDPNDVLFGTDKHKKKKSVRDKKKVKLPKKSEISQPCCFVHVTKLDNPAVELSSKNASSTEISSPQLISASSIPDVSAKRDTGGC